MSEHTFPAEERCGQCGASLLPSAAPVPAPQTQLKKLLSWCRHVELMYGELAEREGSQADRDAAETFSELLAAYESENANG
jgi:hypothetical protein